MQLDQMNQTLLNKMCFYIYAGNKYLLRTHKLWKNLLEHYEEAGCLVDAKGFLRGRIRQSRNRRNKNHVIGNDNSWVVLCTVVSHFYALQNTPDNSEESS